MRLLRRLFFEIDMTWKRLLILAVGTAVFAALFNCIPFFEDTSMSAPAHTFEIWVLFAIIVIFNCHGYREAMVKTFVFFLVSQPLIYLLEVPFLEEGWGLFRYYPGWFVWTICTIPGAAVAYYVKKQNVWSGFIIGVANLLVLACGLDRINILLSDFPRYLLALIFCLACAIIYIIVLLEGKRNRLIAAAISVIVIAVLLFVKLAYTGACSVSYPITAEGNWRVLETSDGLDAEIRGGYMDISSDKSGNYELIIVNESGEKLAYDIEVDASTGLINVRRKDGQ